jgi:basic membrane protein A
MTGKTETSNLDFSRRDVLRIARNAGILAALPTLVAGAAVAQEKPLVALVHTQAAGDSGPIDDMIRYLDKLAGETGIETRKIYAQDPATFETIFRNLGDAKAKIVLTTFYAVAAPLKAVAPDYPETLFIHLYSDPIEPPLPNVQTVNYDEYLASYLSGLYGARVSKTRQLGYIAGASVPSLNANFNALKAAAQSIDPAIKVTPAFVGSFQDPAKAREIALQMYQSGIDYIQTDAAGSNPGIIQAANEGEGRIVTGTAMETARMGPKTMQASIILGFGLSLYNQTKAALEGKFVAGHYNANMKDGVIDFRQSEIFLAEGDPALVEQAKAIWPEIEKAKSAIVDGSLVVPFVTTI